MKVTKEEIQQKIEASKRDANLPDIGGNNLVFGKREKCITPNLLNQRRESLGYNPEKASIFNRCKWR
jgi:hypothetical protein